MDRDELTGWREKTKGLRISVGWVNAGFVHRKGRGQRGKYKIDTRTDVSRPRKGGKGDRRE